MKPFYDGLQDAFARLHLAKFTPASSSSSSSPSSSSLHGEQLRTEDVTLISHTHGRERRAQRGIDKEALKAAVKHGKRSRANPGRAGDVRWRFEHNGVVYITDASCRQEITSWRVNGDKGDEGPAAFIQFNGNITTHTVLVVDHSGSMRKSDVPGFSTRTEAVYEAVASQFIQPQLSLDRTHLTSTTSTTNVGKQLGKAVVSLIEMGEAAHVVFQRQPLSQALFDTMKRRKQSYARSHGNYVPALEALDELLSQEDLVTDTPILILFLSDGAPSDHNALFCRHGVRVWEEDTDNPRMTKAKDGSLRPATKDCGFGNRCRSELKKKVEEHILKFIAYLSERFGQDRLRWHSVAFGPPLEDYKMLQQMASALPQGSFQKLGLAASSLHSALTSLTSTLTSLRTDGGTLKRTVRQDIEIRSSARNTPAAEAEDENGIMSNYDNTWDIYVSANSSFLTTSGTDIAYKIVRKIRYSSTKKDFVDEPMSKGADCVAVAGRLLDKGAERAVFRCSEGRLLPQLQGRPLDFQADMLGPILVAKESIHQEELKDMSFHSKMAKLHAKCQLFCEVFNRRIAFLGPSHQINYLQPVIYEVTDPYYPAGKAWILAEQRLEGKFTKASWNPGRMHPTIRHFL